MARPNEDGEIQCTGCGRWLPGTVKYFHRHRDAFKPKCKECRDSSFGIHDYNKIVETPEGKKICTGCKKLLPADPEHFSRTDKTSDGFTPKCKRCRDDIEYGVYRPNRSLEIPEGMWLCTWCDQLLPLNGEHFYESDGRKSAFEPFCKACSSQRRTQSRRAAREGADDNLSSLEWRFIKAMWLDKGIVRCAYCGEPTEAPERDHVQPLTGGGDTVPENIVPACGACNRSKGDSLLSEWYPGSDVYHPDRHEKIQRHLRGDTPLPE